MFFGGAGWSDVASTDGGVCTWAYPMVRKRRLVTGTLHHPSRPCIMAVSPQHLPLLTRAEKWSLKLSARVGGGLSHDVWRTTGCPFRPPKKPPQNATTTLAVYCGHHNPCPPVGTHCSPDPCTTSVSKHRSIALCKRKGGAWGCIMHMHSGHEALPTHTHTLPARAIPHVPRACPSQR